MTKVPARRLPRVVQVRWQDAAGSDVWENYSDLRQQETALIETVGYVLREDENELVLGMNIAAAPKEFKDFSMVMAIPRSAIRRLRRVKLP